MAATNAPPGLKLESSKTVSRTQTLSVLPTRQSQPGVAWITSSALASDRLLAEFMKVILKRRGVFRAADEHAHAVPLRQKYRDELAKVKVMHLNDGNYHKDGPSARLGREKRVTFFWDLELIERCGILPENVTTLCLYQKPWLLDSEGEEGKYHASRPRVEGILDADRKRYYDALARTQAVVDKVRAGKPPRVWPGQPTPADELAEASQRLEKRHKAALDVWCRAAFAEYDAVVGQGGDVVMVNLAYQVNQPFVGHLVRAVRSGQIFWASMSASTMVCSKSIEMTGEILPGSLENFAVDAKYLIGGFSATDLDDDGVSTRVLGALPLFRAPFAMRPHYSEAWMELVLQKNRVAEAEYEVEMGEEVDDNLVLSSTRGLESALKLLNVIAANASEQDNPVFLPMQDGQAIQCDFEGEKEVFSVVENQYSPHAFHLHVNSGGLGTRIFAQRGVFAVGALVGLLVGALPSVVVGVLCAQHALPGGVARAGL